MNTEYNNLKLEQSLAIEQLVREYRTLPNSSREVAYQRLLEQLFIQKNYYEIMLKTQWGME